MQLGHWYFSILWSHYFFPCSLFLVCLFPQLVCYTISFLLFPCIIAGDNTQHSWNSRMSSTIFLWTCECAGFPRGYRHCLTVAFQVGSWLLLIVVLFSTYFLVFYYWLINTNIIVLLFSTFFSIDFFFLTCTFAQKAFLLMYGSDDILLILKCFNKWESLYMTQSEFYIFYYHYKGTVP